MGKVEWKGGALLGPLPPVMVSCGNMQTANIITVAWTGIVNTHPPKTYISLRPSRHSYPIIRETGEFVINLSTASLIRAVDYCGVRSGKDVDKFAVTGLTPQESFQVSCPSIAQCPLTLECRVTDIVPLGSHDMFLADIVCVGVDEQYVDAAGRLCMDQCGLAAFAHGEYFELGKKIGSFGFSVRKPKKKSRKHSPPKNRQPT